MKNVMQTVLVPRRGGPEVLQVLERPVPVPTDDQILIEIRAADVNPVDVKMEEGTLTPPDFPYTPGLDVAGVIRQVGKNVAGYSVGDEVFGIIDSRQGGYSEYVATAPDFFALKPKAITMAEAASLPIAGTTAWQCLFDHGHLEEGQSVLISGAAGGVGNMAVQLAVWKKAVVFAVASGEHRDLVKSMGVSQFFDRHKERFEDDLEDLHLAIDVAGADFQKRAIKCLRPRGRLISTLKLDDETNRIAQRDLIKTLDMVMEPSKAILDQLCDLVNQGALCPIITQSYPLQEAREAQEALLRRHTGKIVLNVAGETLH
jgi:NADPH:quinone reductase-like Zn-dependent oxidoreductase